MARKEQSEARLHFAEFVISPKERSIERGADRVALTRKTWAVLYYLASHPDRVVTRSELLSAAWPGVAVSDAALNSCIKEVRRALGDKGTQPRVLRTVYGRGYQFIARPLPVDGGATRSGEHARGEFVGRATELTALRRLWAQARSGQRRVGFVTGEAGIGKTALVSTFVDSLNEQPEPVLVCHGQCVEQYGAGEAYHPVLEALNQLALGPHRDILVEVLRNQAPSWMPHLAALLSSTGREASNTQGHVATQLQALRELADAFEALAEHRPVVLVVEDLHWSDSATLAFLSILARRRTSARVLVLVTYRPTDMITGNHLLREMKAELQLHDFCQEIALTHLDEPAVSLYATERLGSDSVRIVPELHKRSGGNPLFLVNLVDCLEREADTGVGLQERWESMKRTVPDQIQEFIVVQVQHLGLSERCVVEAASVNGALFFPALVATALAREVGEVEAVCEALNEEGRFIFALGEVTWPDGSVGTPYLFRHALYREALYQKMSSGSRRRKHLRIGTRLEAGYGNQAREVAAELALHFERGGEVEKAVKYYSLAGQTALLRGAYDEVLLQATNGRTLAETLPPSSIRSEHELALRTLLTQGRLATRGAFHRSRERLAVGSVLR